jgi:hypothetical protein
MMPMIDTPLLATTQALITIGPAAAALAALGILALVWVGRGMAEEARRTAARHWSLRHLEAATDPGPRLAA